MKKRGSYLLFAIYLFLFGAVLVGSIIFIEKMNTEGKGITGAVIKVHIFSPQTFTVEEDDFYLYNITIDNEDVDQEARITEVKITIPESFMFLIESNGTNTIFETFTNTSTVLIWWNASEYLFNGSTDNNYFWFKANASIPGNYNITVTTFDFSTTDTYTHNITVIIIPPIISCETSWTKITPDCTSTEKRTIWWNDTNSCGEEIPEDYENETEYCDGNSNNLIGGFSSFSSPGISLTVYVNDSVGNSSEAFDGVQKIEFKEAGETRVEFDWDFSAGQLNMYEINITKQPATANEGYLIINNLEVSKKVFVDKLDASSNSVCVKDASVDSISSITSTCTGADEKIIPCPGTNSGVTCEIVNGTYKVSGIEHSVVMEFTDANITSPSCDSSWNCFGWGECLEGIQTRTCTDANSCGTDTGKPAENQTCELECIPSWSCDNWAPLECPKDSKSQTRTCTDANNCETDEDKPNESKPCTPKAGINWLFILLIFFVIGAVIGVIILLMKMAKKAKESTEKSGVTPASPSQPPFSPPSSPMTPPKVLPKPSIPSQPKFAPGPPKLPPTNPNIPR